MKKYKSVVVDDDPISLKILEQCISRTGVFDPPLLLLDALSLKEHLKKEEFDVIFLDVELPELSGLDFIKAFESLPPVVLMSNLKKYAVDAFEFEVLDFIPKPVEYRRFLKTINKLEKVIELGNNKEKDENIFFKVNGKLQKIELSNILYFESMADYVKIITFKKTHVILQTMTKLEKILPKNFVRCHRSYIINLKKVDALDDRVLEIESYAIPVSRSYYNRIKNELKILS
jgi:DNA-binding LytR/AlgR family response regulator